MGAACRARLTQLQTRRKTVAIAVPLSPLANTVANQRSSRDNTEHDASY